MRRVILFCFVSSQRYKLLTLTPVVRRTAYRKLGQVPLSKKQDFENSILKANTTKFDSDNCNKPDFSLLITHRTNILLLFKKIPTVNEKRSNTNDRVLTF